MQVGGRVATARQLYLRAKALLALPLLLLTLLALWRDEGPMDRQPPPLTDAFWLLPWWAWVILALALFGWLTFEGAHREIAALRDELETARRSGRAAEQTQEPSASTRSTTSTPSRPPDIFPVEQLHDGVLWQDVGETYIGDGGPIAEGPFCTDDRATLLLFDGYNMRDAEDLDAYISERNPLVCPTCGTSYLLNGKKLRESRLEVEAIFAGLARTRRATRKPTS